MNRTKVTVTFVDWYGATFAISVYLDSAVTSPTDPLILAMVGLMNAMLHAVAIHVEISAEAANAGAFGAGAYNTVNDKAVITWVDEDGDAHVFKIPGPKATIFTADKSDVDFTDALVIAYANAVFLHGVSKGGTDLVAATKGYRGAQRRQNQG